MSLAIVSATISLLFSYSRLVVENASRISFTISFTLFCSPVDVVIVIFESLAKAVPRFIAFASHYCSYRFSVSSLSKASAAIERASSAFL